MNERVISLCKRGAIFILGSNFHLKQGLYKGSTCSVLAHEVELEQWEWTELCLFILVSLPVDGLLTEMSCPSVKMCWGCPLSPPPALWDELMLTWIGMEKKKSVILAVSPGLSLILFHSFSVAYGWGSLFYPQFRIPSLPIKNLEENVISFPLPIPIRYSPSSLLRSVSSLSLYVLGSFLSAHIASPCDYLGCWFGCNSRDQTAMM